MAHGAAKQRRRDDSCADQSQARLPTLRCPFQNYTSTSVCIIANLTGALKTQCTPAHLNAPDNQQAEHM
eukprot:1541693-Pleurochrysis_carterae.AAC.1